VTLTPNGKPFLEVNKMAQWIIWLVLVLVGVFLGYTFKDSIAGIFAGGEATA